MGSRPRHRFQPALTTFVAVAVVVVPAGVAEAGPTTPAVARPIVAPVTRARLLHLRHPGTIELGFPATHLVWSWTAPKGTGIRYRTRDPSGTWGRWTRAPGARDLEVGDRHHSGLLSASSTVAVAWRPFVGRRPPARARGALPTGVTLDYIDAGKGPAPPGPDVAPLFPPSQATDGAPVIVTRAQWGADESLKATTGVCTRRFYPVQQLFVHHTAGSNFDADPYATMRATYWYHVVRRGWCDLGYNFVVGPDGTIFEGRWARAYGPWEVHSGEARDGRAVAGAHVSDYNSGSVGISVMGNFEDISAPPAVRRSLAELLAWEADRHGLDPLGNHVYRNPQSGDRTRLPVIAGHRDAGETACPGDRLYRALPEVRRDTAAAVGAGKAASALVASASATTLGYGGTVTISGTLTDEAGTLGLRVLTVYQRYGGGSWGPGPAVTTGIDGSFTFDVTPEASLELVVAYEGDEATWGAQSDLIAIGVRPVVTIEGEGGAADLDGTYHYPAGTAIVPLVGEVSPGHPGQRVTVRVGQVHEDGTATPVAKAPVTLDEYSRYRFEFASPIPPAGVRFRAVTWFVGDHDHKAAFGGPIFFTIDP